MKPIPDGDGLHAEDLRGEALAAHLRACVACSILEATRRDAARADEAARADLAALPDDLIEAVLAAGRSPDAPLLTPPRPGPPVQPASAEADSTMGETPKPPLKADSTMGETPKPPLKAPASVAAIAPRRRRSWAALAFAAVLILAATAVAASRWGRLGGGVAPGPAPSIQPGPGQSSAPSPEHARTADPDPVPPAPAPPDVPSATSAPRAPIPTLARAPSSAPPASASAPRDADAPETAAALFARANDARRAGRGAEALRLYDELGSRFSGSREDTAARVTSGWLLLEQLGQPAAALARFDRYLQSSPGGTLAQEALAGRALALMKLGRHPEELAAWRRLLEVAPGSAYAPRARARLGEADR